MPLKFFPKQESDEEKEQIKQKAANAQAEYELKNKVRAPKEKGIEELELEESVPGGQYLSMVTPMGLGKGVAKAAGKGVIKAAGRMGLKELAEKGAPKVMKEVAEKAESKALSVFRELKAANDKLIPNKQKTVAELRKMAKDQTAHAKSINYHGVMGKPEAKY